MVEIMIDDQSRTWVFIKRKLEERIAKNLKTIAMFGVDPDEANCLRGQVKEANAILKMADEDEIFDNPAGSGADYNGA